LCVYRIVQEALNNIAQHSGATTCIVSLDARDRLLRLVVEDNGCGLDAAAAGRLTTGRGLGLIGMRERAQALGGTFSIGRRDGGGTSLAVTLPLDADSVTDHAQQSIRRAG